MDWFKRYLPPTSDLWEGRRDGHGAERYHEVVKLIDLREGIPTAEKAPTYGLIGFASDEGIKRNLGRLGAFKGPQAFRSALAKLPYTDPASHVFLDLGDIVCEDGHLEETQASLGIIIAMLLAQNIRPIVIGGGHEIAWGNFQGISTFNPMIDCAIVNFDAHLDLRPLIENVKGTSGTSFTQIAEARQKQKLPFNYTCIGLQRTGNTRTILKRAQELSVNSIYADEIYANPSQLLSSINDLIKKHDAIYMTICLDVFAAPFAPGVSSPQPLGLLPAQLLPAIRLLAQSNKVISFDIAELSPSHDQDNRTSLLAASLLATYLS